MRKLSLVMSMLLAPAALLAQTPAAPAASAGPAGSGAGKVAVIDLQKAITENADGKKAQEKFMAEFNKKQKDFEDKQKALTEAQTKLQTQDKALSETAKADLTKQIDKYNTDLQRMNDDAQKDLGDLQQQLFRPIAEKAQDVLKSYSNENGFAAVFDVSSQANSIIYYQDVADITTEIIRRIDSTPTKPASAAPATSAPKPPAGATPAGATPAPKK
jgi:Skp family chaperone for outer membrane proteins